MWTIIDGNWPERLSGAAIDSPSRIASRASSTTFSSTVLLRTFFTISSAVSTGTPADSIVASVRAKRATEMKRTSGPISHSFSFKRSISARPRGLRTQRLNQK
jgi:hypothetical protein